MTDLWRLSAIDLAKLIATKQASSAEVVEAHLGRIAAVNPKLNAVVRVLVDEARAGAAQADQRLAAGETLGPLHGVPITVKENIDMAGLPTTAGCRALADRAEPAAADAPLLAGARGADVRAGRGCRPHPRLDAANRASRPELPMAPRGQLEKPLLSSNRCPSAGDCSTAMRCGAG